MPRTRSLLLVVLCALAAPAFAGPLDGSKPLVCASSHAFDCSAGEPCVDTSAESVNMADVLVLDVPAKKLVALDVDLHGRTNEIAKVEHASGRLVVSGADGARGWKLAVDETTGDSVLTVSDAGVALVVYGECALE